MVAIARCRAVAVSILETSAGRAVCKKLAAQVAGAVERYVEAARRREAFKAKQKTDQVDALRRMLEVPGFKTLFDAWLVAVDCRRRDGYDVGRVLDQLGELMRHIERTYRQKNAAELIFYPPNVFGETIALLRDGNDAA